MTAHRPPRNKRELLARAKESITNIKRHQQAMRDVAAQVRTSPPPIPQNGGDGK